MSMQTPFEPYPGLRPYRETEKNNFFGRETDAAILIDKILTNRFTLLFAASGVGKSSLLQAAVIPRLKSSLGENLVVVYHSDWVSEPVQTVKAAVLKALQTKETFPKDLELAEEDLHGLLSLACVFVRPPLVLILDQFEEFFRYQRATRSFNEFIDQLVAVLADKSLAVSLVFSMREDFALELNAFKNKLPTLLFENFYRLEKLNRDNTLIAIKAPVEQLGYQYEPRLLEWLLADLLNREYDYRASQSIAEIRMTAEPPYLQIVCAQLWELNKNDPEKMIRLASYEKAGRAQGIVKNYIQGILTGFSHAEKQLASKAFDHLIGQRGVKIAYTAKALAEIGRVPEQDLAKVLDKLEAVRVLRRQQRGEEIWFELYHDMFSVSLSDWNREWKDKLLTKRILKIIGSTLLVLVIAFATIDFYVNNKFYHFHTNSQINSSNRVELWKGPAAESFWPFDLFNQRVYIAETPFLRSDLEPDKRFGQKNIEKYKELHEELIALQPIENRIISYANNGSYQGDRSALSLAELMLLSNSKEQSFKTLNTLLKINIPAVARFYYKNLESNSVYSSGYIQSGNISAGIYLKAKGFFNPSNLDNAPDSVKEFWQSQLSAMALDPKVLEAWLQWGIYPSFIKKLSLNLEVSKSISYLNKLVDALDEDSSVYEDAILTLADLELKKIEPRLLDLIKDKKIFETSSNNIELPTGEQLNSLVALQVESLLPSLIEVLDNGSLEQRSIMALLLSKLNSTEAIPALVRQLSTDNYEAAADALGQLNTIYLIDFLISTLSDEKSSEYEKLGAITTLKRLKAVTAIPVLLEILRVSNNENLIKASANALGDLKSAAAIPLLANRFDKVKNGNNYDLKKVFIKNLKKLDAKNFSEIFLSILKRNKGNVIDSLDALSTLSIATAKDDVLQWLSENERSRLYEEALVYAAKMNIDLATVKLLDAIDSRDFEFYISPIFPDALSVLSDLKVKAIIPSLLSKKNKVNVNYFDTKINLPEANYFLALNKLDIFLLYEIISKPEIFNLDEFYPFEAQQVLISPFLISSLKSINFSDKLSKRALLNAFSAIDTSISIPILMRFLKSNVSERRSKALFIALHLKSSEKLNLVQKSLLNQVLSTIDEKLININLSSLEELEQNKPVVKSQKILSVANDSLVSELKVELKKADEFAAKWRAQRDNASFSSISNQDNLINLYPNWKLFNYAFDLASSEPEEGIKLLAHNLYDVREGAAFGIAANSQLDVEFIKKLERLWLNTESPIEKYAFFRAIDMCLLRMENTGSSKELADLTQYLTELGTRKDKITKTLNPSKASILPRVEWTQVQLKWRADALEEIQSEFNAKHLPKFLEEYCLKPDGQPMPPGDCKNPLLQKLAPKSEVHHD